MSNVCNLLAQGAGMMSGVPSDHYAFAAKYNFVFSDSYNPGAPMSENTTEICRTLLNCYFVADNFHRAATYYGPTSEFGLAGPAPFFYKHITRDGCPSIRPSMVYTRYSSSREARVCSESVAQQQTSGMTMVNFIKNFHHEYFAVNIREFLRMLCVCYVHLPAIRTAHPSVAFLFEECMYAMDAASHSFEQNEHLLAARASNQIPQSLPARTIIWPFSRYFSADLFTLEAQNTALQNAQGSDVAPVVTHRFSFYTLMYLCVFCINEIVKGHSPALFDRIALDFQCANFPVLSADHAAAALDFTTITDSLACNQPGIHLPPDDVRYLAHRIIDAALALRFRGTRCANDAVTFLQYDAHPIPDVSRADGTSDLLQVTFRNAFHTTIFANLCNIALRAFPFLRIERPDGTTSTNARAQNVVGSRLVLSHTALAIVHLTSIATCSSQRTRWFSGIMPLYPLVARILIDYTRSNLSDLCNERHGLAHIALLAWLNTLFGNKRRFTERLLRTCDLHRAICRFLNEKTPTAASNAGAFLRAIMPNTDVDALLADAPHYKHSQARQHPLYEHAPDFGHPLLLALHAVETRACTVCRADLGRQVSDPSNERLMDRCAEHRPLAPAPSFGAFTVYVGVPQEEGSPFNPQPTADHCLMALLPNKFCRADADAHNHFAAVFTNALYPILARHEILPSAWNFSL